MPINLQTFVSPLDTTVFLQKTLTLFNPDYAPDQKADPSGLGLTKDTIIRPIGEYSVTDPVKWETKIKAEPLETVGDILTDHSPQCQLWIQISYIISIQGSTRTPTPTDEYSMDSTIQDGIVTPSCASLGQYVQLLTSS